MPEGADELVRLGREAYLRGSQDDAIALLERAFAGFGVEDRRREAADVARSLAFLHGGVRGNRAASNGWMARAERLLDGLEESVEHGRLALDRAPWTDDPGERDRHAHEALRIARRFGDRDLEFSALALLGHALVVRGRVAEGMALIDEAMTAVSGGEVRGPEAVGEIFCRLLGACERATDVRRAEQWIEAARGFEAWRDFVAPTCRMHYGGILVAVGRWPEAEEELLAAAHGFEAGFRAMRWAPFVRLAALRVRQGRPEEAERLVEGSEARPPARQVLAAVALARGDVALARDLAGLCLEAETEGLRCTPLLDLLVEAALGAQDVPAARAAAERLAAVARDTGDGRAGAVALLASGRVLAAQGDGGCRRVLQLAVEAFAALGLPFETARAQLDLARALAPGAPDLAVAEARAALAAFERLGAAAGADAAAGLLRTLGVRAPRGGPRGVGLLTDREREVLRLVAEGLSNPEIAQRLYLSRKTVQHHVSHILAKLDVGTRAEAAAAAVRELDTTRAAE